MEKVYKEIQFGAGISIESALNQLATHKGLVCGSFNEQMLYSDIDDIDSAYKKITGKSKAEFDVEMKAENERYDQEKRKHIEAIPQLTKEWIEKGKKILDEKYHEYWQQCCPVRLADLYEGMELGACLDIIEQLNKGCELETAKVIIENQGHSGMSFSLVCSMVKSFRDRGVEFVNYVKIK